MAMLDSSLISAGVIGSQPSCGIFMNLPTPLALLDWMERGGGIPGKIGRAHV